MSLYTQDNFYDRRGALKTELLFQETIKPDRLENYSPLYTLKENDTDLPSAYKIYMGSTDEYEAAMRLLGSMRHWRRLCGLKWFMDGVPMSGFDGLKSWRKDMELRDKSKSKKQLMEAAEAGVVSAQRALYLSDNPVKAAKLTKSERKIDQTETDRIDNIREIFGSK